MARTIVDLDARATVLDAAARLTAAPPDGDIALVVAGGAPVLRSAVFLEVLRAQAAPRRLSLVTGDPRARALASSAHLPAYASLAALERRELDPTERLEKARLAQVASARAATVPRPRPSLGRAAAFTGSVAAAALILAAVLLPEATVTVGATPLPIGPMDVTVRGTTGGAADLTVTTIAQAISAKVTGTATGERVDEVRATGSVELSNRTTNDVQLPKGTIFQTKDGLQFLSTADATIPRSVIIPPITFFVGKTNVGVQAAVSGETGNVPSGRITVSPRADTFTVNNPEPTTGGKLERIPVVKAEDYEAAVQRAPDALKRAGDEQLQRWLREPRQGQTVVNGVLVRQTAISPSSADLVGKELTRDAKSFDITVSGVASGYVTADTEPRHAIATKLRDKADEGNDVSDASAAFDVRGLSVAADGVTWEVTARGQQMRRIDQGTIARLLAGRQVRDAEKILSDQHLSLVRLDWVPSWWPLLPLLDARINVETAR